MEIQFDKNGIPFVIWGDNEIRLEKEPLTDKSLLEKAETELRETPEIREKALEELKRLLKEEKTLVLPIEREDFLLKFLRPCKFYAESAFKRMQAYYKFRISHSDYCRDLTPLAIRLAFDHSVVSILAPRDQHGRRIMMVESGERWNPRDVPLSEVFRGIQLGLESAMVEPRTQVCGVIVIMDMKGLSFTHIMQFTPSFAKMIVDWIQLGLESAMVEPRTQVCGVIVIMDMKGLSFTHIMQFTPSFAKMIVDWIQDCVPIRLKAVHIVNQPFIFNMLFAIFKPFLREKLRSRIHFHGSNKQSLLDHVDPSALRQRHWGSLPDPEIPGDVLWKMLHYYEEDFKLANSYGYISNNKK